MWSLVGTDNYFWCGKGDHKHKYCPIIEDIGNESNQAQATSSNPDAPTKNSFYALLTRGDQ